MKNIMITNNKEMKKNCISNGSYKRSRETPKGKQKHNDKYRCNNTDISAFPNNTVYMFIV